MIPRLRSTRFPRLSANARLPAVGRIARGLGQVVAALVLVAQGNGLAAEPVFRAGAAVVDITPTHYPVRVNAMFTERSATNAVDPLQVRALALDDGKTRIVLGVVDTCMMARDLIDAAKEQASHSTGIPTSRMLVSATHTHSAPSAMGCLGSRLDTNYAAFLVPRLAQALVEAVSNLVPAEVGWGSVEAWEHTFNRRWIRRPDQLLTDPFGAPTVRAHMHPGHESPEVVGPSGPVDPELSVLGIRTADGRPLALLANFSQHYYGSSLLSSDYFGRFVGHVAALIAGDTAPEASGFTALLSQGTSGDLMWMDYSAPARDIGYDAYARELAEKVAGVWRKMTFQSWVPLRMAERMLTLRYRVPDAARLAWARTVAATVEGRLPQTLPEIYALEALYLEARPQTELKLQALRVGDLGIAAWPNEVFALTGLKLKARSPLVPTFNLELANGAEGYIPPPEQHGLGGYTTWPARTAGLEIQAEPRLLETLLELLEEVAGQPRRPMPESHGPYARTILAARPLAYWRLNESIIPLAHDATGNGHQARFEEGLALFLPGASRSLGFQPPRPEAPNSFSGDLINRAPHLAGGRIRADRPVLGATYSVELWFWNGLPTTARPVTGHLLSRGRDGDPEGDHLLLGGSEPAAQAGRLVFSNGRTRLAGRTPIPGRQWHQVVVVREGARVRVHLDGDPVPELEGELEVTGRPDDVLFLGGSSDRTDGLEGKLDEVSVYDRALSPGEIAKHFAQVR